MINVNWERILHKPIFKTKHKKIWILTTPPAALLRKKNCSTVDKNIPTLKEEKCSIDVDRRKLGKKQPEARKEFCAGPYLKQNTRKLGY